MSIPFGRDTPYPGARLHEGSEGVASPLLLYVVAAKSREAGWAALQPTGERGRSAPQVHSKLQG